MVCKLHFADDPDQELAELDCKASHTFHLNCLEEWLKYHDDCPLCHINNAENE